MKRIAEFFKKLDRVEMLIIVAVLGVMIFGLVAIVRSLGSSMNEARINKLESEKQQFLKREQEARERDLILQGQIKAKDEQIADLTSRIEDSNERVSNAHKETVSARTNYDKVRSDPPKFNSADDAGRVVELGSNLHGLYPDSP